MCDVSRLPNVSYIYNIVSFFPVAYHIAIWNDCHRIIVNFSIRKILSLETAIVSINFFFMFISLECIYVCRIIYFV